MAEVLCDICYRVLPLNNFWFSTCGHGFCSACTTSLDKSRTCPSCRKPRKKSDLHKLYFTLPERQEDAIDVKFQPEPLVRLMTNIRRNSSLSSVNRATEGLKEAVNQLSVDADIARKLLKVAEDMEERLRPLFFHLQLERDEKRALQEKVNSWQQRVTQVEQLTVDVARLKRELESASCANQRMVATNRHLTIRLEADRSEIEKLRKDVIDARRQTKERNEMLQRLERDLMNAGKQASLAHKKLKVLTRSASSTNPLSVKNSTDDLDSLIVEPVVSEHPVNWDTFVKAMTRQGFTYDQNNPSSIVQFVPLDSTKRSITFLKPHPDDTIDPFLLKVFNGKFRRYYGRDLVV